MIGGQKFIKLFLKYDVDKEGKIVLAATNENLIICQKKIIDYIIFNNNMNGILNSYYISQLDKEIDIPDATEDEIKIDDNVYSFYEDLVSLNSMRNIFTSEKL